MFILVNQKAVRECKPPPKLSNVNHFKGEQIKYIRPKEANFNDINDFFCRYIFERVKTFLNAGL